MLKICVLEFYISVTFSSHAMFNTGSSNKDL